uniref:Uncharacterized protein n=1 Tax=Anopheles maculatus TaxID=74869 RepID=A0A182T8G1_9DIPT
KSRRTKTKTKSQSTSRPAKNAAKASRTKSKSKLGSRGAQGRANKRKKRTKPSSDVGEDEPSRSTSQLADEDTSTRAHYVIASRPSVSPTVDVTTVDGTDVSRERKLKSVIIKRCHYNKASTNRSNGEEETASGSAGASRTEPSTSTSIQDDAERNAGEQPAGHTNMLKCILSSASSSSSDSESEQPLATVWRNTSAVTPLAQTDQNAPFQSHNQQQDWPRAETFIQQGQLPLPNTDQQQLEADESTTTGASESLFEPALSWAEETVPDRPLLPEDRALSSAAASPFSSISFPPSTTSVSPSPSMSSQSLALAAVPSPLQLIESLGGTMDSSDSPLPSSVLGGIDAIDGTIDEIMASEVINATAPIVDAPPMGINGGETEAGPGTTAVPCEVLPTASDGAASVQLQL